MQKPVKCKYCGILIFFGQNYRGNWMPFESWYNGRVNWGEYKPHKC